MENNYLDNDSEEKIDDIKLKDDENGDRGTKIEQPSTITDVPTPQKYSMKKEIFEWVQAIVIAVVIALVIRTYVFSLIKVNGQSMYPTLHHDDRLIVVKLMYKPRQGDIIILNPPDKKRGPFVKRIIALPGQTVDIDTKTHEVKVDGIVQEEDFINEKTLRLGDTKFPIQIPNNHVFVMGDNRNNSLDSRYSSLGPVPYKQIIGKVTFRLWPFKSVGYMYK
jgi:signal peptidase I